ncbi:MAG: hypothetical protein IT445_19045 [Phycisphaeraceae bacterium]|nr:hypothetical protein [Phycisphaeraceae bacterium]
MTTRLILIPFLTLAMTLPALGQQAAGGQSGRALDANLRVGSGGANSNNPMPDYRLRNDLVTGNVAGGRGFQGDIGYTAPGEFQGALGSDSLFNFRAESLYSAPALVNTQPLTRYGGGTAPVFRSYTNLAGQSLSTGGPSGAGAGYYYEGGQRLVSSGSYSFLSSPLVTTSSLSAVRSTEGQTLALSDSPLLGVRQVDTQTPTMRPPITPEQQKQLDDASQALNKDARISPTQPPQVTVEEPESTTVETDTMQPQQQQEQQEAQPLPGALTLALGQQLQPNAPKQWFNIQQARESILENPKAEAQPSVYSALMAELREKSKSGKPLIKSPVDETESADLEQPDQERVKQAEQAALEAIRKAYGIPEQPAETELKTQAEQNEVNDLLGELNYDLPAFPSLAGAEKTRSNQLMGEAEAALASGDFFKAESAYKQAQMLTPDDPMPSVGMMHAQLGAGMIRSSALNLRRLFERHPELIAARYEARLLPSAERLRWVQGELNQLIESPDSTDDPGIMMAYLGYQVQSRQLIRYGLAMAQSRDPRDPLLPVLRSIWLDAATPDAEADAPAPPPAAVETPAETPAAEQSAPPAEAPSKP